jgi:hypothetical protein
MTILRPFLSTALLHRFAFYDACVGDWFRKYPDPNLKPPFGLDESGAFTGSDEEAKPHGFQLIRTESERNGSYLVHVRLN